MSSHGDTGQKPIADGWADGKTAGQMEGHPSFQQFHAIWHGTTDLTCLSDFGWDLKALWAATDQPSVQNGGCIAI